MRMSSSPIQLLIPESVQMLCEKLHENNGQAWLVGGCIRDLLLGIKPKDWDVEVFGLEEENLAVILKQLGRCEYVGKQFGVRKLWLKGLEIDVALPRKEIKTGQGHQGFDVVYDPNIAPEQATLRRDFTINAMMYNPLTRVLLDMHQGQIDLDNKVLRHVSSAFIEDPLRPLRAMQFAARFGMCIAQETAMFCQEMIVESDTISVERVWQEWVKWSKSDKPSMGLKALKDMGWDVLYPELTALQHCPQDACWHPEGDVWIHTCLVVDEAARLAKLRQLNERDRLILLFAALCHDFGKPQTTFTSKDGKICSPNHGKEGVGPSLEFLKRIGAPKWLKQAIAPLVCEHVAHFSGEPTPRAVRRLAQRLEPMNIFLWEVLTEADACGRMPLPPSRPALAWLECAQRLDVVLSRVQPLITGQVLLGWGMSASPRVGRVLKMAYEAQMDGKFNDQKSAYNWFQKYAVAIK